MNKKIEREGKVLLIAYDHGLEHGPSDFNLDNVNPDHVLNIAEESETGIVLQKGIAEKYYPSYKDIPLVVKLNGKTCLGNTNYSPQVCSVDKAVDLGADAIGYTIYPGSKHEGKMFSEFSKVQEKARDYDLPVITWSYPRGPSINEHDPDIISYAARIALELGSDYVKVKYPGDKNAFAWTVENSDKQKVLSSGGSKMEPDKFIEKTKEVMDAGASGLVIGRNIWQREKSLELIKKVKNVIWS